MLKVKSYNNARNNLGSMIQKNNKTSYNKFPANITSTQNYQNQDINLSEGNEIVQTGGSFDSRERVLEIKKRHMTN